MKNFILFALLFSFTLSWAQQAGVSLDQNTSWFINNLENRGISSYFTIDRTCDAQTTILKAKQVCETKEIYLARYILWKENGVTKIKHIDNCGIFTSYSLDDAAITDYYTANMQDIQYTKNDASMRRKGLNNCSRKFMFKNKGGAFVKKYNLIVNSSDAISNNRNKEHNSSLPIAKLDNMIDVAIKKMESNKAWSRM